jgi:Na+-translocating ferredoxin:NAD+ oxidoreductase RNF subunit RnfB
MSNALLFLVIPVLVAVIGSLVLSVASKQRQIVDPPFTEQLRALAPQADSRTGGQPSGIVPLDEPLAEED